MASMMETTHWFIPSDTESMCVNVSPREEPPDTLLGTLARTVRGWWPRVIGPDEPVKKK